MFKTTIDIIFIFVLWSIIISKKKSPFPEMEFHNKLGIFVFITKIFEIFIYKRSCYLKSIKTNKTV